jgi:hypothetical protein
MRPVPIQPGDVFNELTALSAVGGSYWLFKCSCGRQKKIRAAKVRAGDVKSCGHGSSRNYKPSRIMLGAHARKPPQAPTPKDTKQKVLRQCLERGMAQHDIARLFRVSPKTIRKARRRNGAGNGTGMKTIQRSVASVSRSNLDVGKSPAVIGHGGAD